VPERIDLSIAVRGMLEAAGLTVRDDEIESLVTAYTLLRSGADRLSTDELRYEESALLFTPAPPAHPQP
jgi:hypothetical protein